MYILRDFIIEETSPALLFCDNTSDVHIAKNYVYHDKTKHLDIDSHFVRSKLQASIIHLMNVTSKNQLADLFAKALHLANFLKQVERLGLISIS